MPIKENVAHWYSIDTEAGERECDAFIFFSTSRASRRSRFLNTAPAGRKSRFPRKALLLSLYKKQLLGVLKQLAHTQLNDCCVYAVHNAVVVSDKQFTDLPADDASIRSELGHVVRGTYA